MFFFAEQPDPAVVSTLVSELLLIAAVAMVSRYLRAPYTLALVATGLVIGLLRSYTSLHVEFTLTPDLLFTILLPPLLFEAAIHLDWNEIKQRGKAIGALAVPGLLLSSALVGFVLHWTTGMRLAAAMVFGTLISATDPISVLALFKANRAPSGLSTVVEGESLLNDGAAVVTYQLVIAYAMGNTVTLGNGVLMFLLESVGGLLVGAALGWLCWKVTEQVDDHLIEITLTSVLAFGAYLLAQHLHTSGVMAVIAAGVLYGRLGMALGLSANSRLLLVSFWEYMAFLCNSLVFLLIGTQVDLSQLLPQFGEILAAFLIVVAARAVVVAVFSPVTKLGRKWHTVVWWAGVRGSIAMALAMGVWLPERNEILLLTFGVVLLSLFVQGLSMAPLLRKLKLIGLGRAELDYELRLGELLAQEAALHALGECHHKYHLSPHVYDQEKQALEQRIEQLKGEVEHYALQDSILEEQRRDARHIVAIAQLDSLRHALSEGLISRQAFDNLRHQLLEEPANEKPSEAEEEDKPSSSPATAEAELPPE